MSVTGLLLVRSILVVLVPTCEPLSLWRVTVPPVLLLLLPLGLLPPLLLPRVVAPPPGRPELTCEPPVVLELLEGRLTLLGVETVLVLVLLFVRFTCGVVWLRVVVELPLGRLDCVVTCGRVLVELLDELLLGRLTCVEV